MNEATGNPKHLELCTLLSGWHDSSMTICNTVPIPHFHLEREKVQSILCSSYLWRLCLIIAENLQDFKKAASLSAESKALASTMQAKEAEAAAMAKKAAALDAEEIMSLDRAAECQANWQAADKSAAFAQWRLLQVRSIYIFSGNNRAKNLQSLPFCSL